MANNVYDEGREELLENDEVDAEEEAFMRGYEKDENESFEDSDETEGDKAYEAAFSEEE